MKSGKIGRYGIDWGENEDDLTEKDYGSIFIETTKIIENDYFPYMKEAPIAFYDRGVLYLKRKEYQKAISDFSAAIKLADNDSFCHYNRGYAYYYLRKYGEALKDFKKALELYPDSLKSYPYLKDIKYRIKIIESEI
jgi:tetratricopeptide (TPR) repeat protein